MLTALFRGMDGFQDGCKDGMMEGGGEAKTSPCPYYLYDSFLSPNYFQLQR